METLGYDAHEKPPVHIRDVFKRLQRMKPAELEGDADVVDLTNPDHFSPHVRQVDVLGQRAVLTACSAFGPVDGTTFTDTPVYEHDFLPGTQGITVVGCPFVTWLLHRDLSDPRHATNIHFHHTLPYQANKSFFSFPLNCTEACEPLDANAHKPIAIQSMLEKKLRWMTLGGQYDWTRKEYPAQAPEEFPPDVAQLLESLFPGTKAEAAIVNLYTPGDTLSMHRDVAESCNRPLVSISIGCDAMFVIGLESTVPLALRLKSGDAVLMTGRSRFAWHGVPKIIPDTCPKQLEHWPAESVGGDDDDDDEITLYAHWKGWLRNKRINLNVRQMWE